MSTSTIAALCLEIESDSFIVRLSPTNVPRRFAEFASSQPEMQALINQLRTNPKTRLFLLERIRSIASTQPDYRYQNPWDIPLSCYLIALYASDQAIARVAAMILRTTANSWWIPRIIEHLEALTVQASETTYVGNSPRETSVVRDVRSRQDPTGAPGTPIVAISTEPSRSGSADVWTLIGKTSKPAASIVTPSNSAAHD